MDTALGNLSSNKATPLPPIPDTAKAETVKESAPTEPEDKDLLTRKSAIQTGKAACRPNPPTRRSSNPHMHAHY